MGHFAGCAYSFTFVFRHSPTQCRRWPNFDCRVRSLLLRLPHQSFIMETIETKPAPSRFEKSLRNDRLGKIAGGVVLIGIGVVLFLEKSGIQFPHWLFSFEMFLIALGLFILARNAFRSPGGLVIMLIGAFFLLDDVIPGFYIGHYFWPLIVIAAGLWVMFSPGRSGKKWKKQAYAFQSGNADAAPADAESVVNGTTFFGGTKKMVSSQHFQGGKVETYFGGTEINLSQADLRQPAVLELTQMFGGTKIICPAHWVVQSDIVSILGGVEDKRKESPLPQDNSKVLILRGTTILGGVDIKSY